MNAPIVVGTDGSDTAGVAVATAISLAQTFGQPLHIVSAYQLKSAGGSGIPAEMAAAMSPHSAAELVLSDAALKAKSAGIEVTTHPVVGSAAEAILDLAESVGAGLIVIGNRGIGSKARFVLGNVPSKVVHHSPCSTYIVHTTD